jgi:S-(hydroxymethyl)glutathione dehydrogenase/alcohol dehydrogenase
MEIEELDLDRPQENEVLIRYTHAGLCHSDIHLLHGDVPARIPMVLGHEAAGIIEETGPGVTRVKAGDHVVCSFIPNCGVCRWCATGQQAICDWGATILDGCLPGGRFVFGRNGSAIGAFCMLGTFSEYGTIHQNSVVRIDDDLPLDRAALMGCGVPTGWGSSVYAAGVEPGDTILVVGIGGIGSNAVQGARHAGARYIVAADPLASKREKALFFGATHTTETAQSAYPLIQELTRGVGADKAVLTVDVMTEEIVTAAFAAVRKGGTIVLTGLSAFDVNTVQLPGAVMSMYKKTVKGTVFGDCNPTRDIPMLLDHYRSGNLNLDDLITRRYRLADVNEGYDDLLAGEITRGLLTISEP